MHNSANQLAYPCIIMKTGNLNDINDMDHITQLFPCPLGFHLAEQPPKCECIKLLNDNNCKCFLGKRLLYNCTELEILDWWHSNKTLIHTHCPFQYCGSNLENSAKEQCSSNRADYVPGILCGGCKPQHSLALGTSVAYPTA